MSLARRRNFFQTGLPQERWDALNPDLGLVAPLEPLRPLLLEIGWHRFVGDHLQLSVANSPLVGLERILFAFAEKMPTFHLPVLVSIERTFAIAGQSIGGFVSIGLQSARELRRFDGSLK
jgi:hypothetical protein